MKRILLFSILIFTILPQCEAAATLDEVQSRLLGNYRLPLRWDNVEGAPSWLGGEKPAYNNRYDMHTVRLGEGQYISLWLPADETLRIHSPGAAISADDVEISLSGGSGLYRSIQPVPSADGRSLLVSPDAVQPLIGRVMMRNYKGLDVAIFTSRVEPPGKIAPYRRLIKFPENAISLRADGEPVREDFWFFMPDTPRNLTVSGPARLVFEHRMKYPGAEKSRRAAYRLSVSVDSAEAGIIEFETVPETERLIFADGKAEPLSRLETGYIEIPSGEHSIIFETTANLYGRVLVQDDPDYLFPSLNSPVPSPGEMRKGLSPDPTGRSLWSIGEDRIQYDQVKTYTLTEMELTALRIARDNARKEGGMTAQALVSEAAAKRRDYPDVRSVAGEMEYHHSFYRQILPAAGQKVSQHFRWFSPKTLKEPDDGFMGKVSAEQHLHEITGFLKGGYFFDVPFVDESPLIFVLPERFAPSTLLVALYHAGDECTDEIMVQFDNETPVRMKMLPEPDIGLERYDMALADAGLAMLRLRHHGMEPVTLSGPFGMRRYPAPMVHANTAEITVPVGPSMVRVRRADKGKRGLGVALFLRSSNPFTLSETEYLGEIDRLGKSESAFAQFIALLERRQSGNNQNQQGDMARDNRAVAARELCNVWLPLVRLIKSLDREFSSSIVPPVAGSAPKSVNGNDLSALSAQAEEAEKAGQWLIALEIWTDLFYRGMGIVRNNAAFSRVKALQQLGETYLAERLLRGMMLFGENSSIRHQAYVILDNMLQTSGDMEGLMMLRGAAMMRMPSAGILKSFVETLNENREYHASLMAAMLLPEGERPLLAMIRAACSLGWQHVFSSLPAGNQNKEWQHILEGQRLAEEGKYAAAKEQFSQGGEKAQQLGRAMDKAFQIRGMILSSERKNRMTGLLEWQQWQQDYPGTRIWHEEPETVTDCKGAALLYSIARDVYSHAYMAGGDRPVVLRVLGPVKMRIEARPVLKTGTEMPVNGWLKVVNKGVLSIYPLNDNIPQEGLRIVGDINHKPGRMVNAVIMLGPGVQELEISGEPVDMLLRIFVERPELPSPLLPPLTPDTAMAALKGMYKVREYKSAQTGFVWGCPDCLSLIPLRGDDPLTLRVDLPEHRCAGSPEPAGDDIQPLEFLHDRIPESNVDIRGKRLFAGDISGALAVPFEKNEKGVVEEAAVLLWLYEKSKDGARYALAGIEMLGEAHPEIGALRSILNRIRKQSTWGPVTSIQESAGLRYLEVSGWEPESPHLRVRKAMMRPVPKEEYMLSGDRELAISMINTSSVHLRLTMASEEIAYFVPKSMNIRMQLDDGTVHMRMLKPEQPFLKEELVIPAGRHTLRVAMEERFMEQYLRVRIEELDRKSSLESGFKPLIRKGELPYYVATPDEPVKAAIEGPAWLRVDTVKNGRVNVAYRFVEKGIHTLLFYPGAGEGEALIRIHQKIIEPEKPVVPPRFIAVTREPVPPPYLSFPAREPPGKTTLRDAYRLGGQEDGTLSLGVSYIQRRSPEGEDEQDDRRESFFETEGTHRFFWKENRIYTALGAFGRIREHGGPAYGASGYIYHRIPQRPYAFNLDYALFLQNPQGSSMQFFNGRQEWSGLLKGSLDAHLKFSEKAFHIPSLSVFGRALSMSDFGGYRVDDVDQDIFTSYKADHRQGASLSENLYHRPWLDTLWHIGGTAGTNNDFDFSNPDHLSVNAGWKQLMGPLRFNVLYRFTRYLKDSDRTSTMDLGILTMRLAWERWLPNQHRIEAGLGIKYYTDSGQVFPFFSFTWHMGTGRAYKDFRPGDIEFLDLKELRVPQDINNVRIDGTE